MTDRDSQAASVRPYYQDASVTIVVEVKVCPLCGERYFNAGAHAESCRGPIPTPNRGAALCSCGQELTDDIDCGGDCVWCMADAGDPECVEYILAHPRHVDPAPNRGTES